MKEGLGKTPVLLFDCIVAESEQFGYRFAGFFVAFIGREILSTGCGRRKRITALALAVAGVPLHPIEGHLVTAALLQ